jgi:hypothetical protein
MNAAIVSAGLSSEPPQAEEYWHAYMPIWTSMITPHVQ